MRTLVLWEEELNLHIQAWNITLAFVSHSDQSKWGTQRGVTFVMMSQFSLVLKASQISSGVKLSPSVCLNASFLLFSSLTNDDVMTYLFCHDGQVCPCPPRADGAKLLPSPALLAARLPFPRHRFTLIWSYVCYSHNANTPERKGQSFKNEMIDKTVL